MPQSRKKIQIRIYTFLKMVRKHMFDETMEKTTDQPILWILLLRKLRAMKFISFHCIAKFITEYFFFLLFYFWWEEKFEWEKPNITLLI